MIVMSHCNKCGDRWVVFPSLGYAGCLRYDFVANREAIALSAGEAKSCGIDVAGAIAQHIEETRGNVIQRLAGRALSSIVEWWCRRREGSIEGGRGA